MRVTENNDQTDQTAERPARGALLAAVFGVLIIGMVVAYEVTDRDESSIEAVSSLVADQSEQVEARRAMNAVVLASPTTSPPSPAPAAARVYEPGLGELEGEIVEIEQRVLSVAPATVPAPPTSAKRTTTTTTTTAVEEPTTTEETTTEETTTTAAGEPGEATTAATDTTVAGTPESAEGASETSEPATVGPTVAETTTTAAPAPAPTAHPDGWVDAGHGIHVPPVLLAIRFCESRDDYNAANPSSSARGAYQFLTGSWAGYGHAARYGVSRANQASPAQQDEAALLTWQRDGTRPWNASRHCWG